MRYHSVVPHNQARPESTEMTKATLERWGMKMAVAQNIGSSMLEKPDSYLVHPSIVWVERSLARVHHVMLHWKRLGMETLTLRRERGAT